jgi:Phage tail assembly chaperone proteins, E, or 41 or 14
MTDEPENPDEAPAPAKANGADVSGLFVLTLTKPIMAHGEEISELKFREPTAADIEACGSPIVFDAYAPEGMPKTRVESKNMFAMMSRLAAVPPSTIRQMSARQWEYAANVLAYRFFIFET